MNKEFLWIITNKERRDKVLESFGTRTVSKTFSHCLTYLDSRTADEVVRDGTESQRRRNSIKGYEKITCPLPRPFKLRGCCKEIEMTWPIQLATNLNCFISSYLQRWTRCSSCWLFVVADKLSKIALPFTSIDSRSRLQKRKHDTISWTKRPGTLVWVPFPTTKLTFWPPGLSRRYLWIFRVAADIYGIPDLKSLTKIILNIFHRIGREVSD
jgi:hypothetical protein